MKKLAALAAIPVALIATAGCSASADAPQNVSLEQTAPKTFTGSGSMTLYWSYGAIRNEYPHCAGMGGYSNMHAATQVLIKDSAGKVLADTQLGTGKAVGGSDFETDPITACVWGFAAELPKGEPRYGVEIGTRGILYFTEQELTDGSARLSLNSK